MQVSSFFTGPHKTPKSVKILMWIIALAAFLAPILTFLLNHYLKISGPSQWFALSAWGVSQGWFWQIFTYGFVYTAGIGISLSMLITVAFHLFLLWFAGSEIEARFGIRSFILFYIGALITAGLFSAAALLLFSGTSVLVGSGPPIYALLMVWAMLYPDLELYFFFFVRVKAKWLIAILLGITLLVSLSYGHFIPFLADVCAILFGFAIGRLVWKLPNPYPLNLELPKRKKRNREGKIINLNVMKESDEEFMDRMLEKIAKKGEASLTKGEQERMRKISENRKD